MKNRLAQLLSALDHERSCNAFLIVNPSNIEYVTGFPGQDIWVFFTRNHAYVMTDKRYSDDAESYFSRKKNYTVCVTTASCSRIALLQRLIKRHRCKRVGFESDALVYAQYAELQARLSGCHLIPNRGFVERLRMQKDSGEIAKIRAALACNERVFASVKRAIARCRTEKDLVEYAHTAMKRFGGEGPAFDTIVACGKKSAIPHARSDAAQLMKHTIILIDMGVKLGGYCSDLTRTFFYGRISSFYRDVYDKVLTAQEIAISMIKPGARVADIDGAVRDFFKKYSCDAHFTHALGHGLGRDVHEMPSLSVHSKEMLEPGMVITVEPGLYYPGKGGVRIEDMVLVTKRGATCLSQLPKEINDMHIK